MKTQFDEALSTIESPRRLPVDTSFFKETHNITDGSSSAKNLRWAAMIMGVSNTLILGAILMGFEEIPKAAALDLVVQVSPLLDCSRAYQNSGSPPPVLPTTCLITSGPTSSGPQNSSRAPWKASGPSDSRGLVKLHSASMVHNQAVTNLSQKEEYSIHRNFPKPIVWSMILLFVMGFIAGGFILGVVHNPILLIVVVVLFALVVTVFIQNTCWGRYENAFNKVERRKLFHMFLKQFLIVYKNWEPLGQSIVAAFPAVPPVEYSQYFDDTVVGCSTGHPVEIILIEELKHMTTLVAELNKNLVQSTWDQVGTPMSLVIAFERLPILDTLTIIMRSSCKVFGHYGGIQKLTALMKETP
ncbi:hypothetical protein F0562_012008 [Nyssa sinensis]|uniref:Uncharacterized protein n=1 Tax=Nyssa sinensis TaxID=561372 RepID=A0A5J4ZRK8_9ASTE|nr:hypothetical protein F0562_012008 [Nyssa sinensis]